MIITKYGINAKQFLKDNNFKLNEISNFLPGFISKEIDVTKFLIKAGFELHEIEKSNLNKLISDDKLIFPVRNSDGYICDFIVKNLDKSDKKNLNTFFKNDSIYNFFETKKNIRKKNFVIVANDVFKF